ncbi:MAG: hypothetical protein ACK55Z_06775 [bacterium]
MQRPPSEATRSLSRAGVARRWSDCAGMGFAAARAKVSVSIGELTCCNTCPVRRHRPRQPPWLARASQTKPV